jgi:hypothetical protein
MEDITSIILPDLSPKKRQKKEPEKILVEKQKLSRINRTIVCKYCEEEKILNPDQYQALFDLHGSEEKINEEFYCKSCDVKMRKNPYEFWARKGDSLHELGKNLKNVFESFRVSQKSQNDVFVLQNSCAGILSQNKISPDNVEFIIDNQGNPTSLKIKNFPFIGEVMIHTYEPKATRLLFR